jgi:hypothetical protein
MNYTNQEELWVGHWNLPSWAVSRNPRSRRWYALETNARHIREEHKHLVVWFRQHPEQSHAPEKPTPPFCTTCHTDMQESFNAHTNTYYWRCPNYSYCRNSKPYLYFPADEEDLSKAQELVPPNGCTPPAGVPPPLSSEDEALSKRKRQPDQEASNVRKRKKRVILIEEDEE